MNETFILLIEKYYTDNNVKLFIVSQNKAQGNNILV